MIKSGDKELLKPLYIKNQGAFGHGHWDEQEFNSKVLPEFDKLFSNKELLIQLWLGYLLKLGRRLIGRLISWCDRC